MRVTQKDVAEKAGVSRGVVSRVMHGGADTIRVSPETEEHVRLIAQEMGYQPNAYARNFRRSRTGMIGVLHAGGESRVRFSSTHGYFATLMDGIVTGAFARGYTVGLCPDLFGPNPETAMTDGRFDGLIWYNSQLTPEVEEKIRGYASPLVLLHVEAKRFNDKFPTVICDNQAGIEAAMYRLANLGHRRIAYLAYGQHRSFESLTRFELICEQARRHKMDALIVPWEEDRVKLNQMFEANTGATAIIAYSDQFAADAMRAAQRHGLRVPEDISIIGFDSTAYCELQSPPLTSISQPLEAMGAKAAEILVDLIEGRSGHPAQTVLPCGLDIRGSTGPVPITR